MIVAESANEAVPAVSKHSTPQRSAMSKLQLCLWTAGCCTGASSYTDHVGCGWAKRCSRRASMSSSVKVRSSKAETPEEGLVAQEIFYHLHRRKSWISTTVGVQMSTMLFQGRGEHLRADRPNGLRSISNCSIRPFIVYVLIRSLRCSCCHR